MTFLDSDYIDTMEAEIRGVSVDLQCRFIEERVLSRYRRARPGRAGVPPRACGRGAAPGPEGSSRRRRYWLPLRIASTRKRRVEIARQLKALGARAVAGSAGMAARVGRNSRLTHRARTCQTDYLCYSDLSLRHRLHPPWVGDGFRSPFCEQMKAGGYNGR